MDLAHNVKYMTQLGILRRSVKGALRPVALAIKEAGILISASPWAHLAVPIGQPPLAPGNTNGANGQLAHQQQALGNASFGSSLTASSSSFPSQNSQSFHAGQLVTSPTTNMVPATPLSAALRPAAQAAVPSSGPVAATMTTTTTSTMATTTFAMGAVGEVGAHQGHVGDRTQPLNAARR